MKPFPSSLFDACIELLAGSISGQSMVYESARCFLQDLGYLSEDGQVIEPSKVAARSKLLAVAAKLDLFPLRVPEAPRAHFIGGRVESGHFFKQYRYPVASLSGLDLSLAAAFEACVGEAVEYISQLEHGDEPIERLHYFHPETSPLEHLAISWDQFQPAQDTDTSTQVMDGLGATALSNGKQRLVPTELCLRRQGTTAQKGLSSGCAAGANKTDALTHALLELIERDAAALWWSGGQLPRPLPLETITTAGVGTLLQHVGRVPSSRHSTLLDISTDIGIPCIAAVSASHVDGRRFACGLAARLDPCEAIRKALLEMLQMELSHHVLAAKRAARGDEQLNEHDWKQLARDQKLSGIWETSLLRPTGLARDWQLSNSEQQGLGSIVDKLTQQGFEAYAVDLTRDYIGLPVVKVLVPGLQPNPGPLSSPRLQAMIKQTGGGDLYTKGTALL